MNTANSGDKTESPTSHKIKQAQKLGHVQNSSNVNSFCILFFSIILLWCNKSIFYNFLRKLFIFCFTFKILEVNNKIFFSLFLKYLYKIMICFCFFFICIFLILFFIPWIIYKKKIKFFAINVNIDFLNFFNIFKKIISWNTIFKFFTIFLQVFFMFSTSIMFFLKYYPSFNIFFFSSLNFNISLGIRFLFLCSMLNLLNYFFFIILDFFWQKFQYFQSLKMTKKEIQDEYKELEGNPFIKSHIRYTMKNISKNSLLQDLKKADVLIYDSENYAIALQYIIEIMEAPKVISRGKGYIVSNMKKIADFYDIPLLESKHIAKILYENTSNGYSIPNNFFQITAEIFAWVWQFKIWKKKGGNFPTLPKNFKIFKKY
ncbi:EscU/YscU/HrcU family type III secretion system export apparatus switch protein [Buchnera aphidicola]|uniref:Flagellar biosynthetic protein FlhB n=1 Tax=Buchnera aphidicola subsp. Tuberolachnus salignus TaxID=98804 RepID=A0A170PBQ1_BUCTT|nr:EscU/YscU/HrcU family type III secretion system export apparatus switch protein [Buchnera aphidicola]CUR53139.1 Flagellar biosynthetic protein FlhB [Buchnera aphidicola (Tuberolachnus salignus)]